MQCASVITVHGCSFQSDILFVHRLPGLPSSMLDDKPREAGHSGAATPASLAHVDLDLQQSPAMSLMSPWFQVLLLLCMSPLWQQPTTTVWPPWKYEGSTERQLICVLLYCVINMCQCVNKCPCWDLWVQLTHFIWCDDKNLNLNAVSPTSWIQILFPHTTHYLFALWDKVWWQICFHAINSDHVITKNLKVKTDLSTNL